MYKPSFLFDRTAEEKRDIFKSWARADQPFFAAGACHILAELFIQLHHSEGFKMIYIKPYEGFPGNHVYASNGEWAFDYNGWTKENSLLKATEKAYKDKYPGWGYERHVIEPAIDSLERFCKENYHCLPWQYAHLPWERAYTYIAKFDTTPPTKGDV
jgi:hypothetical protein